MNTSQKSCIEYQLHRAKIRSKIAQENSQESIKTRKSNKNQRTCFLSTSKYEITTKRLKVHQETYSNFFRIFARKLTCVWIQVARKKVCIARKLRNNERKTQSPRLQAQTHVSGGSGSFLMPWRRQIDPDDPRTGSNGHERKGSGPGQNRPDPYVYI